MLDRRSLLAGAVTLCGSALVANPAASTAQRLDAVDVHPPGYPTVEAVKWIATELEQATSGRIRLRQFPSGQLGGEDDSLGFARYKAVAFCRVAVAAVNNAVPETRLLSLPYGFRSTEHMRRVVDGSIGSELLDIFGHRGLVGLAYYDAAPRSVYNIRGPIETPADMAGLKIRAPQSDMFLATLAAMGANPTPLGFGGVYSALETHLIDGAENNLASFESSRHFETARYWSETEHNHSPDVLLMSKAVFDDLAPADRDLLRAIARRSVPVMRALWDTREAEARTIITQAGVSVNRPDRTAFEAVTRPVIERSLTDSRMRALYQRIQAEG